MIMDILQTEVLTWEERAGEATVWIAARIRRDEVAQGNTEQQAIERLLRAIACQCIVDAAEGKQLFEGIDPPPDRLVRAWRSLCGACHSAAQNGAPR